MDNNTKYKSLDYWNDRYKDEEHFEWFGSYDKYKSVVEAKLKKTDKILVLGCGNSRMSEDMYLDGYENIVNSDYSPVVIERMRNRCAHMEKMTWVEMDINKLEFDNETFDCVLEKGTIDALLVDEKDPWSLSEENSIKLDNILENVSRVLKSGGVFLSITFAQPHFRKPIYAKEKYNWSIEEFRIGDMFHYFVYAMVKGGELSEADKNLSKSTKTSLIRENRQFDLNENDISNLGSDLT